MVKDNILGLYGKSTANYQMDVHTPDGTKYHSTEFGLMIPRSTKLGASKGYDHLKSREVTIDPEFTGGLFKVDLAKIKANPQKMVDVIKSNTAKYEDNSDVASASFAEFINSTYEQTHEKTMPQSTEPQYIQTQKVDFSQLGQPVMSKQSAASFAPKSIANVFTAAPKEQPKVMKKVTFELPIIGQFSAFYHDIVCEDGLLVLVFDHNQGNQNMWFPKALDDLQTREPVIIPVVLHDTNTALLVYPTDVRFKHGANEYCLLTVEKEKQIESE